MGHPGLQAYERYHDPNQNDTGYCAECHPGFGNGLSDTLHALHTGSPDRVTDSCKLCHTGSGRGNPLTMWSIGDAADGLGCAGCHGKDYGGTVEQNYGGFPTSGKKKNSGWGLRLHHANNGVTRCAGCHNDGATNPPTADDGTPWPEDALPDDPGNGLGPTHYYDRSDVSLGGTAVDPCTNEDSDNDADAQGLDNDGDNLYDQNDPDCGVTNNAPVANDDSYTTAENTQLGVAAPGVLGNDTDVEDGTPDTALLQNDVSNGTLLLNGDGSFTYDPDTAFTGQDTFTYHAQDSMGTNSASAATVTISVQPTGCPSEVSLPPPATVSGDESFTASSRITASAVTVQGGGKLTLTAPLVILEQDFQVSASGQLEVENGPCP